MATKQQVEEARLEGYRRGAQTVVNAAEGVRSRAKELQTLDGLEGCMHWLGWHRGLRVKIACWREPAREEYGGAEDFGWSYYLLLPEAQIPADLHAELIEGGGRDKPWSPWARTLGWHGELSMHIVDDGVCRLGADYGHLYDAPGREIDLAGIARDARSTVDSLLASRPDFLRRCSYCGKHAMESEMRDGQLLGSFVSVRCLAHDEPESPAEVALTE